MKPNTEQPKAPGSKPDAKADPVEVDQSAFTGEYNTPRKHAPGLHL